MKNKKMENRGYVLMIDALLALVFLLIVVTAIFSIEYSMTARTGVTSFKELHYTSENVLSVLTDKGTLDEIVTLWAENSTPGSAEMINASNLSREYLEKMLPPGVGYRLTIDDEEIYNSTLDTSRTSESDSIASTHSTRILAGYGSGLPTLAYTSTASLGSITGKRGSAYVYFGGFEGQGNITKKLEIEPADANVTGAYMELNPGANFTLYVNGEPCGSYAGAGLSMSASSWTLPCKDNFTTGWNVIDINFTENENNFIGGGYIRVDYSTSQLQDVSFGKLYDKFWFPGIKGLINIYSSFYVPGILKTNKGMDISLHYKHNLSNVSIFLNIGGYELYRSDAIGERTVTLSWNDIWKIFKDKYYGPTFTKDNLSDLFSRRTIPVKFGTDEFYIKHTGTGSSDAILITDVSGSMGWGGKLTAAKVADKKFVNTVLGYPGMKVGLVSYESSVDDTHPLSDDNVSLINEIDGYSASGCTCISCGIQEATDMLKEPFEVIEDGEWWKRERYSDCKALVVAINSSSGNWKYNISVDCGDDCDPTTTPPSCVPPLNPTEWNTSGFNDIAWASVNLPNDNDSAQNETRYYRKHFTLLYPAADDGTLYVRNKRGVECYLNGKFIEKDTSCSSGTYWDNTWTVDMSFFNVGGNVLACRVKCGEGTKDGIRFDAELTYPSDPCDPTTASLSCTPAGWNTSGFDDSGWANVNLADVSDNTENKVRYYRKNFTVDHPLAGDGTLYVRNKRGVECYLNGNFIGKDTSCSSGTYWDNTWTVDKSFFNVGGNVLACRVRCGEGASYKGIRFDAKLAYNRTRAMLVMSDGYANKCLLGNVCNPGSPPNMVGCPNSGDPNYPAKIEAIDRACKARDLYDITVYSVGFGAGADEITLKKIACWDCTANDWLPGEGASNCSRYYKGSTTDIEKIYEDIAHDIAAATIDSQQINITFGSVSLNNIVYYNDSYINFEYGSKTLPALDFGDTLLILESARFGNVLGDGDFFVPNNTRPLDAKVISYSGEWWTDRLAINSSETSGWEKAYNLSDFGYVYKYLGDPYFVSINQDKLGVIDNLVKIGTGKSPDEGMGASQDDKVIYMIAMKTITGHGEPKRIRGGCNWTVEFFDRTNATFLAPFDYTGPLRCSYTNALISYDEESSIDDAVYRLFDFLDIEPKDGRVDIKFNPDNIAISTETVGGIRSLWGPVMVKLILWT